MPITVDVTVPGGVNTSVTSESTKATSSISVVGPTGPRGRGFTLLGELTRPLDSRTDYWAIDKSFVPYSVEDEGLGYNIGSYDIGSPSYNWGNFYTNTGYFQEVIISGDLKVTGDFF